MQLEGPPNKVGTEHYYATVTQRKGGNGTYGGERYVAYRSLRAAGLSVEESKELVRYADEYFLGKLGMTLDTPTKTPGNRSTK